MTSIQTRETISAITGLATEFAWFGKLSPDAAEALYQVAETAGIALINPTFDNLSSLYDSQVALCCNHCRQDNSTRTAHDEIREAIQSALISQFG